MKIKLNPAEITLASHVGTLRQIQNVRAGRQHAHGLSNEEAQDWQIHCEGCLSEFAVAKFLEAHWCGNVGNLEAPDVDQNIEVRTTKTFYTPLIVRPRDKDERLFVSLVGSNGTYTMRGWIYCHDAKQEAWYYTKDHRDKCYWVPTEELNHPSTLKPHFYERYLLPRINSLLNATKRNPTEIDSD